jgi:hypothetical protein
MSIVSPVFKLSASNRSTVARGNSDQFTIERVGDFRFSCVTSRSTIGVGDGPPSRHFRCENLRTLRMLVVVTSGAVDLEPTVNCRVLLRKTSLINPI